MIRRPRFNEAALIELREAIRWYKERSPEAASRFTALVNTSILELTTLSTGSRIQEPIEIPAVIDDSDDAHFVLANSVDHSIRQHHRLSEGQDAPRAQLGDNSAA